jgi:ribose 5-phosphate isomerase A
MPGLNMNYTLIFANLGLITTIMRDYKLEAAKASLDFIKKGQTIGLGAGSTVASLVNLVAEDLDLVQSLTFVSSSFKTRAYLQEKGLRIQASAYVESLDVYFDGCDQFDQDLNALKSGGGIHTSEKILASMANDFILIGDSSKSVVALDNQFPLVVEILHEALPLVLRRVKQAFPHSELTLRMSTQKDGAVLSENGNLLADIYFNELPPLDFLNVTIKMIPGIVEHSLFYQLATKAIVAGENGITMLTK